MLDPKSCKHTKTRKAGIVLQSGKKRQRIQCVLCGKYITNGEIKEESSGSQSAKNNFQMKSSNPAKEGGHNEKHF